MIKPGTAVLLRQYEKNPYFFDSAGHMRELSRDRTRTWIVKNFHDSYINGRVYELEGLYKYVWREEDLIIAEKTLIEPNIAFKMKREE